MYMSPLKYNKFYSKGARLRAAESTFTPEQPRPYISCASYGISGC